MSDKKKLVNVTVYKTNGEPKTYEDVAVLALGPDRISFQVEFPSRVESLTFVGLPYLVTEIEKR